MSPRGEFVIRRALPKDAEDLKRFWIEVKQVRLSVLSENVGAVKFYARHGFNVYRYGMRKEIH